MDLIEDIGPILGIVAFLGFAVLALLIVLQAREVRRLREWAGRAPERAVEADEATAAATAAAAEDPDAPKEPSRLRVAAGRYRESFGRSWAELDRRSPVNPLWIVGLLVVVVVAAGVVTSGFGLGGGGGEDEGTTNAGGGKREKPEKVEVAVLNATVQEGISDPVPGVAALAGDELVRPAGFKVVAEDEALTGETDSVILYEPDSEEDAQRLADEVKAALGRTEIQEMDSATRELAKGAPLALLIGFEDSGFAAETATAP